MSTIELVAAEIFQNIYGLRSARGLAADSAADGNHQEACRHRSRALRYALTIRNIVRERRHGAEAFRLAVSQARGLPN